MQIPSEVRVANAMSYGGTFASPSRSVRLASSEFAIPLPELVD
jgi:hypothetical protein